MKPWEQDLPRAQLKILKKINQSQPWFHVAEVLTNIYAIVEPFQFQEVISYLIIGDEKALLWDSGNGIGDMKKLVEELTDKPVMVLNSHRHCDHIGSNYQFDEVYVYSHKDMIDVMEQGISQAVLDEAYGPQTFSDTSPIPYKRVVWRRCGYQLCSDQTEFDLGRRRWKVVYAPGHSSDSILLVNDEEKIVMSGDTYYPAMLYCFDKTLFDDYVHTIRMCRDKYSDYVVLTSHNEPICQGSVFKEIADFFEMIQKNQLPFQQRNGMKAYEWQGHSILKK